MLVEFLLYVRTRRVPGGGMTLPVAVLVCVLFFGGETKASQRKVLPNPPQDLAYTDLGSKSVVLEWNQPTPSAKPDSTVATVLSGENLEEIHIHAFIIEITNKDKRVMRKPVLSTEVLVDPAYNEGSASHYRYTLNDLKRGGSYTVRVAASGERGIGKYSQPITFTLSSQAEDAELVIAIVMIVVLGVSIIVIFITIVTLLVSSRCTRRIIAVYRNIAVGRSVADRPTNSLSNELHHISVSSSHCSQPDTLPSPGDFKKTASKVAVNINYAYSEDEMERGEDSDTPGTPPPILKDTAEGINLHHNPLFDFKVVQTAVQLEKWRVEKRQEEETVHCAKVPNAPRTVFIPHYYTCVN